MRCREERQKTRLPVLAVLVAATVVAIAIGVVARVVVVGLGEVGRGMPQVDVLAGCRFWRRLWLLLLRSLDALAARKGAQQRRQHLVSRRAGAKPNARLSDVPWDWVRYLKRLVQWDGGTAGFGLLQVGWLLARRAQFRPAATSEASGPRGWQI